MDVPFGVMGIGHRRGLLFIFVEDINLCLMFAALNEQRIGPAITTTNNKELFIPFAIRLLNGCRIEVINSIIESYDFS